MKNHTRIIMTIILILILSVICFVLGGCSSFSPKDDKNVSYTFETISYESPNSLTKSNVGSYKQTIKLPKL